MTSPSGQAEENERLYASIKHRLIWIRRAGSSSSPIGALFHAMLAQASFQDVKPFDPPNLFRFAYAHARETRSDA